MARRLQDDTTFPPEVRELAGEANLPVSSWHVGPIHEEDEPAAAGNGNGQGPSGNGNTGRTSAGGQPQQPSDATPTGGVIRHFFGGLRLPRLAFWHRH